MRNWRTIQFRPISYLMERRVIPDISSTRNQTKAPSPSHTSSERSFDDKSKQWTSNSVGVPLAFLRRLNEIIIGEDRSRLPLLCVLCSRFVVIVRGRAAPVDFRSRRLISRIAIDAARRKYLQTSISGRSISF